MSLRGQCPAKLFALPSPDVTAEMLSRQEACLVTQDLQDQVALLMRQATCDMQRRIRRTASLVVGRLVCAATVEHSDKKALTDFISNPTRKCKLQDLLNQAGSQESPEDFARTFDEMYSDSCEREHPSDRWLARMVKTTREQPLYSTVQAQGSCVLECTLLDTFNTEAPFCMRYSEARVGK